MPISEHRRDALALVAACVAVALIVVTLRLLQKEPNPTNAALMLLLVVLATATAARLRVSIATSVVSMLAFNYFLLPPFYTLTIADPQNWVALFVFVAVAVIASHLSAAARHRATEAEARKLEVTRLFDLSRDILLTTDHESAIPDLARYVARRFELQAVAICLPTSGTWQIHQGAEREVQPPFEELDRTLARLRGPLEFDARHRTYGGHAMVTVQGEETTLVPLRLGTKALGILATRQSGLDVGALDALGGVVAIAIERAQFLAERKKAETLSQRAELASALLASFSHDLRTPVTSIRVAVSNLQDAALAPEVRQGQAHVALQELDRLTRLLQDILDMARIDAAAVNPERQWVTSADVVDAAVAYAGPVLHTRTLRVEADGGTEVRVDPRLTSTALAHVLENAGRYSGDDVPIAIRAWTDGTGAHFVVRDHGPGLDPIDLDHVFEPFYRGQKTNDTMGTGLGLAIARGLLMAEDGRIWCENVSGGGAQFTITVPGEVRASPTEP